MSPGSSSTSGAFQINGLRLAVYTQNRHTQTYATFGTSEVT